MDNFFILDILLFGIIVKFYSFSWHLFFVAILNGFSEYKKGTAISVYSYVAGLLISLFLMLKFGINGALISISVLSVFQFLFSGYYFVQYFSFQLILLNRKIDFRNIKQILPLGLMTLFSAVLAPILYIFIRNLITKEVSLEAAGYYEAMQRISGFYMMFISTLITFYFLPELTKAKSLDKERKLTFAFYKGIIPIFGFGLVLIYFLRNFVIQVLLTKEFELVSDLFLWQLLGDFFRALALILGIRFYAKKMMKHYFVIEIISFTVLFSSSYLLIPKFGSEGAVMAYAVTYVLYFVVLLFYFRKLFFKYKIRM
jgi:PST family polysaccharide transporter